MFYYLNSHLYFNLKSFHRTESKYSIVHLPYPSAPQTMFSVSFFKSKELSMNTKAYTSKYFLVTTIIILINSLIMFRWGHYTKQVALSYSWVNTGCINCMKSHTSAVNGNVNSYRNAPDNLNCVLLTHFNT